LRSLSIKINANRKKKDRATDGVCPAEGLQLSFEK